MKLKSLLLGSAAAMIAVTGAKAADAIVAEPEPMEYVKVCDMYGAGFFYIPGTETCLAFSGYVRVDVSYNTDDPADIAAGGDGDHLNWDYRARFNVDARNETDWGTLRSQIRFQGDGNGGGDAAVGVDRALISLTSGGGTFQLGYSDGFTTTFHGYGLPIEKNDGLYGYDQAIFFDYIYTANGFSIGAGVQDSTGPGGAGGNDLDIDYYVGARYAGSWGNIAASYIYEDDTRAPGTGGGAWKVSATVTAVEGLTIRGFYVGDGSGDDTASVSGTGDYAWGVGAAYQMTDTLRLAVVYSDDDDPVVDRSYFAVGANWTPIPGLRISPEARFGGNDAEQYTVRVYRTW